MLLVTAMDPDVDYEALGIKGLVPWGRWETEEQSIFDDPQGMREWIRSTLPGVNRDEVTDRLNALARAATMHLRVKAPRQEPSLHLDKIRKERPGWLLSSSGSKTQPPFNGWP